MYATSPQQKSTPKVFEALDEQQADAWQRLSTLAAELAETPHRRAPRSWFARVRNRLAPDEAPVIGIYFWGGVGRGKTHLMDAFFGAVPLEAKRRMHFHHFMQEVHEELTLLPPQPDPLEVLADNLAERVRLLCLDEFIVTDITDAMILHGLLRAFFERGVTLVTTSNTPPDDLYANGLQRDRFLPAIALLKEHTETCNLDAGTDYRLRALQQADVFFSPLDARAEAGLARHFANLSGGHEEATQSLVVNHREIPVRRIGPGVCWFAFESLCEGPRATSDFIEIAREYHTVMLSGVPLLPPARDAGARRFLHLVDEFYDRNVKLILSAAAPVEDLYQGTSLAFEFQRLQSRLVEMRSVDYLARPHLAI